MADNEDDLVIQIDEERRDDATSDDQANDPVAQFKLQLDALKKDNEKRKAEADSANRRAAEERAAAEAARQEATTVRAALVDRESDTLAASIAAAQAEAEAAEKDYAAAAEGGDFKKQAEAQRRIARAEAKVAQFETTKAELELRKSVPNEAQVARRAPSDPFEDHLRQFTPRTQDWMRDNRDWVTDRRKSQRLVSAHHVAVAAGLEPDSEEYFSSVEKTLGIGQREEEPARNNGADNGQQQRQPARRATPAVAPVNGGAGGHSSGSGNSRGGPIITLTKGEADRSEDGSIVWNKGNMDPKTGEAIKEGDPRIGKPIGRHEYARRKLAMEKGGYYDKMYSHG